MNAYGYQMLISHSGDKLLDRIGFTPMLDTCKYQIEKVITEEISPTSPTSSTSPTSPTSYTSYGLFFPFRYNSTAALSNLFEV